MSCRKRDIILFLVLPLSVMLTGCLGTGGGPLGGSSSGVAMGTSGTGGASSGPVATPTPSPTPSSSCTTSVIDYGEKGIALARGLYSDVHMIPGTRSPATAYVDQSTLNLRFTYFDGSRFVNEIVSGDGVGTFVRLSFLSTGVPIIVWAQGANLKAAVRTDPVTVANSAWTAAIIDTGVAPRAIEMSVNPLDQVAVSYISDTAATGRPKFVYCPTGCSSPSAFQVMTPNAYVENTNVTAAVISTGIAWCRVSAASYYPAMVYSLAAATRYAVCQNTLTNCLNSANWTATNVVASSTVGAKLYLDSTVNGDVPRVAAKIAGGVATYRMGATACTAAPAAFAAGSTIGGATFGTQWFTLLKDAANKFHLVGNQSTTNVRYFNSQTTDINGAWNAVGNIETLTLAAAHGGGADIDTGNSGIYASYPGSAAPFDFHLSRVTDYTVSSATATYDNIDIDLTGAVHLAANQRGNMSVSVTSAGKPGTTYVDYSVGAVAAAKLKYSFRSGSAATDAWNYVIVPETGSPQQPALAYDHLDKPWVSYFDASYNKFFLATNSSTDGTGTWTTYQFPALPAGAPAALPAANETALAMYYSGGVASPVMIVIDTNAGSRGVKAAMLDTSTRAWSAVATIDALGASAAANLSADFDSSGNIVIGYRDITVNRAKYNYATGGTTWAAASFAVSGANGGYGLRIRINPYTTKPAVSYYEQATNVVYYAPCSGTIATCIASGWSPTPIEAAGGVSGLAAASYQLISTALAFSSTGSAYIAYPRGQGANGSLTAQNNSSGSFVTSILNPGANGYLSGTAAINFAVAGWGVAATRTSSSGIVYVYVGPGDWLYMTSCGE